MSTSLTSAQSVADAAAAGLTGSSSGSASSSSSSSQSALASLTDNYQSFLQMLMTQLQNQDPTDPMSSDEFTSELVEFSGVEQQINTNSNLTQLIQLTQGSDVIQSGQLLGKQVQVTSNQLSLQNSAATIDYTATTAGPVAIAIYNSSGQQLYTTTVNATQGSNSFTWNGQTASGTTAPDGAYSVAVAGATVSGTTGTLPFTVVGTVTGVDASGSNVMIDLGALQVNMSAVTSVSN